MKIQCDMCEKVEASVFCPSDEAALCHTCDHTIHHANKLATKHSRFSLIHPKSKHQLPLCDICQERRAHLFCQEDRAILCRECDLPIHEANEHTQKHNRFLLTGVKLSTTCLDTDSSSTNDVSEARNFRSKPNRPRSVSNENVTSSSCNKVEDHMASDAGSVSTSSISEYLIETIPGYCFEDFLDASFFATNGFCKNNEHDSAFQDQEVRVNNSQCLFPLVTWVPQANYQVQSHPQIISVTPSSLPKIGSVVGGVKEFPKADAFNGSSKWKNHGCTVPKTCAPFVKKSRYSR